ncbi:hypothetical protein L228DRAFT_279457 [Xylona heveae TC161]|uniref:DNA ligase D 3'-phosphoesterase domain-containing protein n=1 Tax=Xylona heveae (strain CBS 132557 / TC161) TaxID=1328760 RepID=A0A165JGV7_XYLHT|nr:hypothetical protein L228DRAFT_279457 [Xylona heveae TC161]KZF26222.1 hypothetical protein L228DRAFT_279457 [Xylona heveae TC161]
MSSPDSYLNQHKSKRKASPRLIDNPFIKRHNKSWEISPPPLSRKRAESRAETQSRIVQESFTSLITASEGHQKEEPQQPFSTFQQNSKEDNLKPETAEPVIDTAAVEAGQVQIRDHLKFFSEHLAQACRPVVAEKPVPRLSIADFKDLYLRNQHEHGCHFVIHQHDHPVAGVHYDLRLQVSETSSISFAIMYGLPGNPNSKRLNRNATETRVHNLWNHLIETASPLTGSMLIWDTGEYQVLPYRTESAAVETDHSASDGSLGSLYENHHWADKAPENVKLAEAFKNSKIRLRLHGTKLPRNYTLSLRLLSAFNRTDQHGKPTRRRSRRVPGQRPGGQATPRGTTKVQAAPTTPTPSPPPILPSSAAQTGAEPPPSFLAVGGRGHLPITENAPLEKNTFPAPSSSAGKGSEAAARQGEERGKSNGDDKARAADRDEAEIAEMAELEDEQVRATNAYPGATNSIGSVHQRRWFLSLDRVSSGLVRRGKAWVHCPSSSSSPPPPPPPPPSSFSRVSPTSLSRPAMPEDKCSTTFPSYDHPATDTATDTPDIDPDPVVRSHQAQGYPHDQNQEGQQGHVRGHARAQRVRTGAGASTTATILTSSGSGSGSGSGSANTRLTYPFYILGRDHETSIVTGRTAEQVMADEGVTGFVSRKGWRAVLE